MMKPLAWIVALLGTVATLVTLVMTVAFWYDYQSNCGDYLKLAGDAPTLERANEFLGKAVGYIEQNRLTHGNSALIFHTPMNDLGIWYGQIKGAHETVTEMVARIKENPGSVSQLERDNALMKIREVLLDESSGGTVVTRPDHIEWYPHQWGMVILWTFGVIFMIVGWFGVFLVVNEDY